MSSPPPQPTPDSTLEPPTCYRHAGRETWIRCQRCDRPICPDCMHSASVGFQCPECVKEGARSTRQARAPYGGTRVADPRITTYVLIAINAMFWVAIMVTGRSRSRLVDLLALTPSGVCSDAHGAGFYPNAVEATCTGVNQQWSAGVADGAYWQVVTSMFTQVEVYHIAFNMLALFFLGPMLEGVLGRTRFLAVYLVSGLVGSATVMWFSNPLIPTLGASGAVFGLMGALAVVALKVGGQAQSVLGWIAINLVLTFTLSGISWQGHLGGLFGGVVLGAAMVYAPRQHRSLVQWTVTGAVLALAILAIVARILDLQG